jgi:uroporphyrinogen decarboxylase
MTPRERVLTALKHEVPDKQPFSSGGVNQYARRQLAKYLGKSTEAINQMLKSASDLRRIYPRYVGPADRCGGEWQEGKDIWGVTRRAVFNGFDYYMEISGYPLKGLEQPDDVYSFQFPSPDWYDYDSLNKEIDKINSDNEYAIFLGNGNIFESSWYMVGLTDMLELLLVDPELASLLLEKVTDFFIQFFERALTATKGRLDVIFTADDIGQQQGLIMSLPLWEKLIKPHHMRLNRTLHNYGVKIMYHTDGAVMDAVDGLVDMGIDILEALQFDATGMDPKTLKKRWGNKLCFHGGVSVQKTLPYGTPDEVRKEVRERINVLGENGGYILAPSHVIQGGTPPENIIAFLEEAGRFNPDLNKL